MSHPAKATIVEDLHKKLNASPFLFVADYTGPTPQCGPVPVNVHDGRFTHADLLCDTGIR